MAVTIKDIARLSGLSTATVSKFINGGPVREKNRIVLEQVIREQNYRINESARALKTNRSRTIGLVVPKIGDVFASELASAVVQELRKYQYSLMVCESQNTLQGEREAIDFLVSKQVDGIMGTFLSSDGLYYKKIFDAYSLPVVVFDQQLDVGVCDTVVIDNVNAAYQATKFLIDAGHRDIAIVRGPAGHYTADQRCAGYLRAMGEAGLEVRQDRMLYVNYSDTNMYGRIKEHFSKPDRPSAVFSVNYYTTMSIIMALNELDIAVPQDISVFGFDNYYLANLVKPRLWLMEQPLAKIAEEGTRLLMRRIIGGGEDSSVSTVVVTANVVEGDSIRKK